MGQNQSYAEALRLSKLAVVEGDGLTSPSVLLRCGLATTSAEASRMFAATSSYNPSTSPSRLVRLTGEIGRICPHLGRAVTVDYNGSTMSGLALDFGHTRRGPGGGFLPSSAR